MGQYRRTEELSTITLRTATLNGTAHKAVLDTCKLPREPQRSMAFVLMLNVDRH